MPLTASLLLQMLFLWSCSANQAGWLGAQPKMGELKLTAVSHPDAEFTVNGENEVEIKFGTAVPVKVSTKLTTPSNEETWPQFVLTQRKDQHSLSFHVGFSANGDYTFEIFAQEETDDSIDLPNVYNYLIHVSDNDKPATPYAKVDVKFYADYCHLIKPMSLDKNSDNLDSVEFELTVPGAEGLNVHCGQQWTELVKTGEIWEGCVDLSDCNGQGGKVEVSARFDKEKNYVLFEYEI